MDIFLSDLTEEAQQRVLEYLGLSSSEDGNLDVFPLFVLEDYMGEESVE